MRELQDILKDKRIWDHKTQFLYMHTARVKLPDCGSCFIAWDSAGGYEHVSVSPKKKFNLPSWNDMCVLKEIFFKDDEEAYQIHPKKADYVNFVENCLHLWKPIGHELDELVYMKGGNDGR